VKWRAGAEQPLQTETFGTTEEAKARMRELLAKDPMRVMIELWNADETWQIVTPTGIGEWCAEEIAPTAARRSTTEPPAQRIAVDRNVAPTITSSKTMQKVKVRCPKCGNGAKEHPQNVRSGYQMPCPSCGIIISFEPTSEHSSVRKALITARQMRAQAQNA
jgi:hypothetical protein